MNSKYLLTLLLILIFLTSGCIGGEKSSDNELSYSKALKDIPDHKKHSYVYLDLSEKEVIDDLKQNGWANLLSNVNNPLYLVGNGETYVIKGETINLKDYQEKYKNWEIGELKFADQSKLVAWKQSKLIFSFNSLSESKIKEFIDSKNEKTAYQDIQEVLNQEFIDKNSPFVMLSLPPSTGENVMGEYLTVSKDKKLKYSVELPSSTLETYNSEELNLRYTQGWKTTDQGKLKFNSIDKQNSALVIKEEFKGGGYGAGFSHFLNYFNAFVSFKNQGATSRTFSKSYQFNDPIYER